MLNEVANLLSQVIILCVCAYVCVCACVCVCVCVMKNNSTQTIVTND